MHVTTVANMHAGEKMIKEQRLQTIHTTDKALELIETILKSDQPLKINELAQQLKICKEEVRLLLVAVENRGLVVWDSNRKQYCPGGATLEMARNLSQLIGADRVSVPATNVK